MENYIVRIYRRAQDSSDNLTGIVENPDSGDKTPFNNNEEFLNIFMPTEKNSAPNKRKQVIEQRKYRRFAIKDGTILFASTTDIAELIDISMGGLSFKCPNMPVDSSSPFEVGLLCGDPEVYCSDKIYCKNLIHCDNTRDISFDNQDKNKRYSVEFDELTPKQRLQLEHIIQNHAMNEM
jgi:hypothetical protein